MITLKRTDPELHAKGWFWYVFQVTEDSEVNTIREWFTYFNEVYNFNNYWTKDGKHITLKDRVVVRGPVNYNVRYFT